MKISISKIMKRVPFICLMFTIFINHEKVCSQEVVATSGDFMTTAQGSLSWTLGEMVTETFPNGSYVLTQGFQQDYENLLDIDEVEELITFNLYPNPFTDNITIASERDLEIDVYIRDAQSKIVSVHTLAMVGGLKQSSIPLLDLAPGCYFITINIPELKYSTTKRMIKISTNE